MINEIQLGEGAKVRNKLPAPLTRVVWIYRQISNVLTTPRFSATELLNFAKIYDSQSTRAAKKEES